MRDEYLDTFLQEGREAITELNNALLEIEAEPDSAETMDALFRTAHTLKGNFDAMGFDDARDLAHALEDLLDEVREGTIEPTGDVIDMAFEGVDEIEVILDEIEEEGESAYRPEETIDRLRKAAAELPGSGAAEATATDADETGSSADTIESVPDSIELPDSPGDYVLVAVEIDVSNLKGADALLALQSIEAEVTVADTAPSRDQIEAGEFADDFTLLVAGDDPAAIEATIKDAPNVASATATLAEAASEATVAGGSGQETSSDDSAEATTAEQETELTTDSGAAETAGTESSATDDEPTADESSSSTGTSATVDEIESVRVDVDLLDELYRLVEQFVTNQVKLQRGVENEDLDSIGENVEDLEKRASTLQDIVIDMRLLPLRTIVGKFPRLVRDLAREQDKEIDFQIEGGDVEIDRTILTQIGDPLTHILRNAVDHGIEPPQEREAAGKPREGTIVLRAERKRDHVVLEVEDDGGGLDVDQIREQAIERGLRSESELDAMEQSELYDLVFHPGFSTAGEVTDVSGRGVGMDVVHETVTRLDGSINVESEPGEGTTVQLELPVTMAIVRVLILRVGDEEYGVPMKYVDDITTRETAEQLDGKTMVKYDDDLYPVVELSERFDVPNASASPDDHLVRIDPDERTVAIGCDEVTTQQKVVVKPLEGLLRGTPGLSGTAILGDGDILHVLDIGTL